MPDLDWLLPTTGWLLLILWAIHALPIIPMLWTHMLRTRTAGLPEPAEWPRLSVIVPARNEGEKVLAGLESLLASDYPNLEIIAVDDRSTDETGRTMDRVAAADSRVRVIHIDELPAGWLGKNHAMHVGSQAATGELLLFTDGDVLFAPEALRLSVQYLLHAGIDHLTLNPQFVPGGYFENSLLCYFGLIFLAGTQSWLVPTSYKRAYVGIGAFNMLRRAAYESFGGHRPLRLNVIDDVDLGWLVKQRGLRQRLLFSGDLVRVRWQDSFSGVVRGLEKNAFASLQYSVRRLVVITILVCLMMYAPYVGACFARGWDLVPFVATLLMAHGVYGLIAYRAHVGWKVAPLLPFAGVCLMFAFWRSAVLTLRQGGVRWRDTFYPLEELRGAHAELLRTTGN